MNWINTIWFQRFFFCMIASAVAGTVSVLIIMLIEYVPKWKNSRLLLIWIRTALLLYLLPFALVIVIRDKISFSDEGIVWFSEFWKVATSAMQRVYFIFMIIWSVGMTAGIVYRILQYRKLRYILKGNIPLEDRNCIRIVESYKMKFALEKIGVYQNDLIDFPFSTGGYRQQIILPIKEYREKELHMVLEHEMNHIRSRDLEWKKVGMLVTLIHWWNPLAYKLMRRLNLQEEIECDINTCENNTHFTMKEYGLYLAGMDDAQDEEVFISALCKSKKDLFRRLEFMVRGKKYKKWTAAVSCILLMFVSVMPSYAASDALAKVNEEWISTTEVSSKAETVDYQEQIRTGRVTDEAIEEIDLTEEGIVPFGSDVTLDYTIKPKTRVLYRWQDMNKGDRVLVTASCSDSSITYRIGVRCTNGNITYLEGTGTLDHIFVIDADGEYSVFVENRSDVSMKVTGRASYPG